VITKTIQARAFGSVSPSPGYVLLAKGSCERPRREYHQGWRSNCRATLVGEVRWSERPVLTTRWQRNVTTRQPQQILIVYAEMTVGDGRKGCRMSQDDPRHVDLTVCDGPPGGGADVLAHLELFPHGECRWPVGNCRQAANSGRSADDR
jgi:hypothetical protein